MVPLARVDMKKKKKYVEDLLDFATITYTGINRKRAGEKYLIYVTLYITNT